MPDEGHSDCIPRCWLSDGDMRKRVAVGATHWRAEDSIFNQEGYDAIRAGHPPGRTRDTVNRRR